MLVHVFAICPYHLKGFIAYPFAAVMQGNNRSKAAIPISLLHPSITYANPVVTIQELFFLNRFTLHTQLKKPN